MHYVKDLELYILYSSPGVLSLMFAESADVWNCLAQL